MFDYILSLQLDLYRSRCGWLIFTIGVVEALGFLIWARFAAPTRLAMTGVWIAVSSGALGSLMMQFVCPLEDSIHLLVFHYMPIALLALIAVKISRRFLSW